MTPRHPLPEPSLMQRTLAVLMIGALLPTVAIACGRRATLPTAPPRIDGPCTVTQEFPVPGTGTAVATLHYAICPSDSLLAATGWRRVPARSVRGGGYASDR